MNRFLTVLVLVSCLVFVATAPSVAADRPNLLLIITDQQHAGMMSCTGNRWLKTPAMDELARTGVRFERAYAANPVCVPSRFSMFSGFYPSSIGMRHNGSKVTEVVERMPERAMGWLLRRAGYQTVYGGKVHLPGPMADITRCGFDRLTPDQRDGLADACVEFLGRQHDKPFLLVASFINPHDICYMAIRAHNAESGLGRAAPPPLFEAMKFPDGVSVEDFYARHCPPLPENFEPTVGEPDAIGGLLDLRAFRRYVRDNWTEQDWRLHRWAYCRLTERVDAQIGRVLKALGENGLEKDTVVVFTSDHGDMDAAHRIEHKTTFYEEATRVPLIIRYPGRAKAGQVDREHLVSSGIDLIPTLCDYAGVAPPEDLEGRSLRPLAEGREAGPWRESLLVENEIGFMVHTGRYKYRRYDTGENREMLNDLQVDPGEMKNFAGDPAYEKILEEHRRYMDSHLGVRRP
ncbi:MAG TPA: sulfatase-like hydrolase/transferase [Thermoguttaceae bacterium]|nr:sulfatase-like hydrolase/transferase [Thermoguttaceae bacterium]